MAEAGVSNSNGTTTAAAASAACASPGCNKVVEHLLACPKCLELGLPATYFCSQECFRNNYASHKQVHNLVSSATRG
jgi:methionyl aminopeptidase